MVGNTMGFWVMTLDEMEPKWQNHDSLNYKEDSFFIVPAGNVITGLSLIQEASNLLNY